MLATSSNSLSVPSHPYYTGFGLGEDTTKPRSRLTREQTATLKRVYSDTYFPDKTLKEQLSRELGIPVRTIQIWFQNQRQYHRLKLRKKANRDHQNQVLQQQQQLRLQQQQQEQQQQQQLYVQQQEQGQQQAHELEQQLPPTPTQSPAVAYQMPPPAVPRYSPSMPPSHLQLNTTIMNTTVIPSRRYSAPAKFDPQQGHYDALDYYAMQRGHQLPCSPIMETASCYQTPLSTTITLPAPYLPATQGLPMPQLYQTEYPQSLAAHEADPSTPLIASASEQNLADMHARAYKAAYAAGTMLSPVFSQMSLPDYAYQPQLAQQQQEQQHQHSSQAQFATLTSALPANHGLGLDGPASSPVNDVYSPFFPLADI
ncbi:hypothetical protein RI367_007428 [Sorochytrium milnesiophthora]